MTNEQNSLWWGNGILIFTTEALNYKSSGWSFLSFCECILSKVQIITKYLHLKSLPISELVFLKIKVAPTLNKELEPANHNDRGIEDILSLSSPHHLAQLQQITVILLIHFYTTKQTHNSDSSNRQTDSDHLRTLRMLFLLSSDLSTTTDRDRTLMNESSIISISTPPSSALVTTSAEHAAVVVLDPYSPLAHPSWRSFRTASVIFLRYNYICVVISYSSPTTTSLVAFLLAHRWLQVTDWLA